MAVSSAYFDFRYAKNVVFLLNDKVKKGLNEFIIISHSKNKGRRRLFDFFTFRINQQIAPIFKGLALIGDKLEALKLDSIVIKRLNSYFQLHLPQIAEKPYVQDCLKDLHDNFMYIIENPDCKLSWEGEAIIKDQPLRKRIII